MKRISFLLPTFDRARFIAESINGILDQAGEEDEILVIDDGSTDNTAEVVAQFAPRVAYVRQDNAGKSVALNRGMAMTSGEFVMICDDDDVLRPDSVAPLLDAVRASGAGYAFGRYSRFRTEPDGRWVDLGTGYWPNLSTGSLTRHILEDAFIMQNASLVRRAAYAAVGPFDEGMLRSLDYEMFVRLGLAVEGVYVNRYIFDQRKHEGARGPAKALHAAAKSDNVWQEFDRRIFEKTQQQLPIERYEQLFESADPQLLRRVALLQRACVNARHDLWPLTIADLEAAAQTAPGTPLTKAECAAAGRVLNGKHGFLGALEPDTLARLKRLSSDRGNGAAIIRAMLDDAFWRFRDSSRRDALAMRRLAPALIGYAGCACLFAKRKLGLRAAPLDGGVSERRDPPFLARFS